LNILEVSGIAKSFGGVVALSNGNLLCREGRITGLLGANGSGKSTISKIIAGVYRADSGEVRYRNASVHYRNPYEARKDGIAMVYQNLSLVADLTVWQNIVLGDEDAKGPFLDNRAARKMARSLVEQLMSGLDISKMVYELTPGEMQIVEIAKALSTNPRLLILDEPTSALERAEVKSLFAFMRSLAQKGVSIIFTSHRLWEVIEICDDLTIFRNGANVASMDFDIDKKDTDRIIGYITGETQKAAYVKVCNEICGETMLSVKGLDYPPSLKNISFEVRKGEILGIGGLAGQGQRELMLALAGNYPGMCCEATIKGKKVDLTRPANAIRNNMFLVPGNRELEGLFLRHTLYTNLVFPQMAKRSEPLFTPTARLRRECDKVIDVLAIVAHGLDAPVATLSGGNQQKVVVGKWFPYEINVLLLADPAKGVDVGAKRDLYDYIVKRVHDEGMSVILYASDTEELVEYADRILIMYEGQVVSTLEGDNINEDRIITASMRVGPSAGERSA
jgi:ribose transport system ATP-binding protein